MEEVRSEALRVRYDLEFITSPPRTCAGGASDPAMVRLSQVKLRRFHPELFGVRGWVTAIRDRFRSRVYGYSRLHLAEWLYHGDSRAAVVLIMEPLIV